MQQQQMQQQKMQQMQQQQMQQQQMQQQQMQQQHQMKRKQQIHNSSENSESVEFLKMNNEIKKLKDELLNMKNMKIKKENKRKNFDYKSIIQKLLKQVDNLKKNNYKEKYDNLLQKHNLFMKRYQILKNSKGYEKDVDELEKLVNLEKSITENFNKLKIKKQELEEDVIRLEKREMTFNQRKSELDNLLSEHRSLLGKKTYQLEVMPNNFESKYVFNFDMIKNITSLKLISYSLPAPRYNIINGVNDVFSFTVKNLKNLKNSDNEDKSESKKSTEDKNVIETYNDNTKSTNAFSNPTKKSVSKMMNIKIKIKYGKYTIESLLEKLNEEIGKKIKNFTISLNNSQLINVKSSNKFLIHKNNLSSKILGLNTFNKYSNNVTADKCWDLRVPDRLSLFINNINDTVPFGVLYFNRITISNVTFKNPINLNQLDIKFLDSNGNNYNFNNLNHTLSFLVEVNENGNKDDDQDDDNDNQNNNTDNQDENENNTEESIDIDELNDVLSSDEEEYSSNIFVT